MPASGGDPVSAALRLSLSSSDDQPADIDKHLAVACSRVLSSTIKFEKAENYQALVLDNLKNKYILLKQKSNDNLTNRLRLIGPELTTGLDEVNKSTTNTKHQSDAVLPSPTMNLFPAESIQLGWRGTFPVGAGLLNIGNTCYLNATLQALFHVPALVNWLLSDTAHLNKCTQTNGMVHGECIICAMAKTLKASHSKSCNIIKPYLITQKLKLICKHMNQGCQEDAHEFMRYLIESMEKCYLNRFKGNKLDSYTKETTPLNHIFGGYMRTEVRCLTCTSVSTTFQHFQDLLLDIRRATSLDDALTVYFGRERLDDGAYLCSTCKKKVNATKKFSIEKPPRVLCAQLKRFSVMQQKLSKQIVIPQRVDLSRFVCPQSPVAGRGNLWYRFVAMVNHLGSSIGCGHYTAVARTATGQVYHFDDTNVRPVSAQSLPDTNAYVIIYEAEREVSFNSSQTVQKVVTSNPSPSVNHGASTSGNYRPLFNVNQNHKTLVNNKVTPSLIQVPHKPAVAPVYHRPAPSLPPANQGSFRTSTATNQIPPKGRNQAFSFQPKVNGLVPYDSEDSDNESSLPPPQSFKNRKVSPFVVRNGTVSSTTNGHSLVKNVNGIAKNGSGSKSWQVTDASGADWAVSDADEEISLGEQVKKIEDRENEKVAKTKRDHLSNGDGDHMSNKLLIRNGSNGCERINSFNHSQTPQNGKSPVNGHSNTSTNGVPEPKDSFPTSSYVKETVNGARECASGDSAKTNGFHDKFEPNPDAASKKEWPHAIVHNGLVNGQAATNGNARKCEANPPRWNNGANTAHYLQRMSHQGYGSAVNSWTGGKSYVDRDVDCDRREDRKRSYERAYDEDIDRGRSKKVKRHHDYYKPNFNKFQRYQDDQYRWGGNSGKMFFNKSHGHRHKQQRYGNNRDHWRR